MHRRDMELEVANKEFDNAQQTATYDAEENLRSTEERIRQRTQENICALQVERAQARSRLFAGTSVTQTPYFLTCASNNRVGACP